MISGTMAELSDGQIATLRLLTKQAALVVADLVPTIVRSQGGAYSILSGLVAKGYLDRAPIVYRLEGTRYVPTAKARDWLVLDAEWPLEGEGG